MPLAGPASEGGDCKLTGRNHRAGRKQAAFAGLAGLFSQQERERALVRGKRYKKILGSRFGTFSSSQAIRRSLFFLLSCLLGSPLSGRFRFDRQPPPLTGTTFSKASLLQLLHIPSTPLLCLFVLISPFSGFVVPLKAVTRTIQIRRSHRFGDKFQTAELSPKSDPNPTQPPHSIPRSKTYPYLINNGTN